jgi:uncharacterized membrane protein YeiH
MPAQELQLPIAFNLGAVFFFALTGALAARRLGYDLIGVFVLAFATGVGGGLIRDALLRGTGPVLALTDARFIGAVLLATVCGIFRFTTQLETYIRLVGVLDAIGLGAYATVGVDMAMHVGLHWSAAVFVGVANAVGGGLLRDLLTGAEPLLLKPGQFYALAALLGAGVYAGLEAGPHVSAVPAAILATLATVVLRILAIIFNWKTRALQEPQQSP